MGKKAPAAPDYTAAAEATAEGNEQAIRDQTYANRVNQYNPWGSVEYTSSLGTDPASGEQITLWEQRQTLTPEAQAALDSQMNMQMERSQMAQDLLGRAGASLERPTDWDKFSGFGERPAAYTGNPNKPDVSAAFKRTEAGYNPWG